MLLKKTSIRSGIFLLYSILIIPIGLIFKFFRIDPLDKFIVKNSKTYWISKKVTKLNSSAQRSLGNARGDGNKDPTNYPFW